MWGREKELGFLEDLRKKNTSSLVVISGRRRIGKSTLASHFGTTYGAHFFQFTGMAPAPKQTNKDQLNEFLTQMKAQLPCNRDAFQDWTDAFSELEKLIRRKKNVVVLLDEISWLGDHDENFSGKLKIAWDTYFKNHKHLIFIVCGSVSTWIKVNILQNTNFVGRISLSLNLKELPLRAVAHFWQGGGSAVSDLEKVKILSITGCVPKYLEEVDPAKPLDRQIRDLCFEPSGFLYDEFDRIFSEIMGRKSVSAKKIILALLARKQSASQIAHTLKINLSSHLLESLENLQFSGFIAKDFSFALGAHQTKTVLYRLQDNFLRFALKYIEPNKARLQNLNRTYKGLEFLPQWSNVLGLQFENLALNHIDEIVDSLQFPSEDLLTASPFVQRTKTRNKGACQIDLLIQTRSHTAIVAELKLRPLIDKSVIKEVGKKIELLEKKRNWSYRPMLIYEGEISKNDYPELRSYFYKILKFGDLIKKG